jgi:O-acetylserine/cysteine efflux transporter
MNALKSSAGHLFGIGERWAWASALSYAIVNVLIKASAAHIDAYLGSFLRLLPVAALAWFILVKGGFHELRPRDPKYLGTGRIAGLVFGGTVSYVVGNVFFFRAMVDGGLAISVNAVQGGAIWAGVILGALVLRERPRWQQVAGAVVIAIGLTVIAASQVGTPRSMWLEGLVLALGAGTCYSIANVFTRLVQRNRSALFPVLACSAAGGFVPLAVIAIARGVLDPAGMLTGLRAYDVVVILIAGCVNVMALTGIAQAVRHASVATVNTIGSSAVAFSFLASVFIFAEAVPPLMTLGVVAVIGGILFGQAGRRPSPAPRPAIADPAATPTAEG